MLKLKVYGSNFKARKNQNNLNISQQSGENMLEKYMKFKEKTYS